MALWSLLDGSTTSKWWPNLRVRTWSNSTFGADRARASAVIDRKRHQCRAVRNDCSNKCSPCIQDPVVWKSQFEYCDFISFKFILCNSQNDSLSIKHSLVGVHLWGRFPLVFNEKNEVTGNWQCMALPPPPSFFKTSIHCENFFAHRKCPNNEEHVECVVEVPTPIQSHHNHFDGVENCRWKPEKLGNNHWRYLSAG